MGAEPPCPRCDRDLACHAHIGPRGPRRRPLRPVGRGPRAAGEPGRCEPADSRAIRVVSRKIPPQLGKCSWNLGSHRLPLLLAVAAAAAAAAAACLLACLMLLLLLIIIIIITLILLK